MGTFLATVRVAGCASGVVLALTLTLLWAYGIPAQDRERPPFNPVITSLFPSSGAPGTVVDALIRGTDLAGGTVRVSGIGVRVLDASVQDPTTHFLRLYIDPDAAPGPRMLTITVTRRGMTKVVSTTFSVLR